MSSQARRMAPPAQRPLSKWYNRLFKRSADAIIALTLLLTIFPLVYVLVAIASKIMMHGPVLVRKEALVFDPKTGMHTARQLLAFRLPENAFVRITRINTWPRLIDTLRGKNTLAAPNPAPAEVNKYLRTWSPAMDLYLCLTAFLKTDRQIP